MSATRKPKLDPFREAENWTACPKCGERFGWNDEDGLAGQKCACGHEFAAATPQIDTAAELRNARAALALVSDYFCRMGPPLGESDATHFERKVRAAVRAALSGKPVLA